MSLAIVVAVAEDGVIGGGNQMLWHSKEDMRHFRRITLGHAVIMGRLTYESIGAALPKRRNIVVSRKFSYIYDKDIEVFDSLLDAIRSAHLTDPEPRVIGGSQIYEQSLLMADKVYLSEMHLSVDGDAKFPELRRSEWLETSRKNGEGVTWRTLVRV